MLHWYKSNYSGSLEEFINGHDRFLKKYISEVQVCASQFKLIIKEHVRNYSDFFLCFLVSTFFSPKKLWNSWNSYLKNTMMSVLNSKHFAFSIQVYFVVSDCLYFLVSCILCHFHFVFLLQNLSLNLAALHLVRKENRLPALLCPPIHKTLQMYIIVNKILIVVLPLQETSRGTKQQKGAEGQKYTARAKGTQFSQRIKGASLRDLSVPPAVTTS